MRPSRGIAVVALVALVLLRGLGTAADARTANLVECCCGRHAADQDCGSKLCPSHLHEHGKPTPDGKAHVRACGRHVELAVTAPPPPALIAAAAPAAPRAIAAIAPEVPSARCESRIVHPVTPPS